ncbi:MAG: hypothetical protein OK454_10245, partial [Thaumarchaeota archaeon]|nr:hypothetical protein [Nitrososphaerota archaeon]
TADLVAIPSVSHTEAAIADYVESELRARSALRVVRIGANVVVEKTKEEAEKILDGRAKNLEQNIITILSQRNQIAQRLELDRRTLQAFVDRQQEQEQRPQQGQPR